MVSFVLFTFLRVLKEKRIVWESLSCVGAQRSQELWQILVKSPSLLVCLCSLLEFLVFPWSWATSLPSPRLWCSYTLILFSDFNETLDLFQSIKYLLYSLLLIWNWSLWILIYCMTVTICVYLIELGRDFFYITCMIKLLMRNFGILIN